MKKKSGRRTRASIEQGLLGIGEGEPAGCLLCPRPRSTATPGYPPEAIVGLGFRGWIAGYQTSDIGCWQEVWKLYSNLLGPGHAQAAVGTLSAWAKSVAVASRSPISVRPLGATGFCRDECLAISMIAACQHNTCPAMRACAFALIDSSMVDEVLHHAGTYALTLRSVEHIVSPNWIVNANAFVEPAVMRPM